MDRTTLGMAEDIKDRLRKREGKGAKKIEVQKWRLAEEDHTVRCNRTMEAMMAVGRAFMWEPEAGAW